MSYINCKSVVKAYRVGDHELVALKGVDFKMEQGEMVAIVGPSGAGKSSLLNLLGGLDIPTAGQLTVSGQNLLDLNGRQLTRYRLTQVGFIWQNVARNLLVHRNAIHNVMLPMMLAGVPYPRRRKRAHELLESVGMTEHMHKRPAALSGGQQQRVALAVALANQPPLLLLDEPTGALDRQTALQMMDLLHEMRDTFNLTVLMVTHDPEIAAFADRVLTLRDGTLGQDLSGHEDDERPTIDDEGKLQLPDAIRAQLNGNLSLEIRPEGVLLRSQEEDEIEYHALESEPSVSKRRWWFGRRE